MRSLRVQMETNRVLIYRTASGYRLVSGEQYPLKASGVLSV